MPYHIGEKGSNGCSGYPVVSEEGRVAGCHPTESEASNQLQALYANVEDASKMEDCCPEEVAVEKACWEGYVQRGMKEKDGKMVPNCVPVEKVLFEDFGKDYTKSTRMSI